ncbi:MAG: hypothetical protein JOZ90_14800 [Alphaproteobacteria bacterium]|nr:hypothetical protein [Alphaproteobacteria bacterium]MBV9371405.1 hypothetical protein [Alphaproteobacteria bacterium]MBV9902342.1 hypothetical protein [Alphaproteobacteria bacterium]
MSSADEGKPNLGGREGGGDSGGGAYPNPHRGKEGEAGREGWMGHGGQSEMPYHGHGQLGAEKTGGNANAPTRESGAGDERAPGDAKTSGAGNP